jgi:hypothetical protein
VTVASLGAGSVAMDGVAAARMAVTSVFDGDGDGEAGEVLVADDLGELPFGVEHRGGPRQRLSVAEAP